MSIYSWRSVRYLIDYLLSGHWLFVSNIALYEWSASCFVKDERLQCQGKSGVRAGDCGYIR
jgi:hypothetical protein